VRLDGGGNNETGYLAALDDIVAKGKTPAEQLLERYHGEWGGDLARAYDEESF
jgi:glutamate--cysteine ligase